MKKTDAIIAIGFIIIISYISFNESFFNTTGWLVALFWFCIARMPSYLIKKKSGCFVEEKWETSNALKKVQLNPKMRVVETDSLGEYRTFKRTLAGIHYDYCVMRYGITFHGRSLGICMDGWRKKDGVFNT